MSLSTARRPTALAAAAALLVALPSGGCSLVIAHGPPPDAATRVTPIDCTETSAPPVVDTVLAAVGGVTSFLLLLLSGLSDTEPQQGRVALFALPAFVLPAGSAVYGYINTSRCRRAVRAQRERASLGGPPSPTLPGAAPAPPPDATWRTAVVAVPSEARSAPSLVAPAVRQFAAGERITVSIGAKDGWRQVALPDRFAYIRDEAVRIDAAPSP